MDVLPLSFVPNAGQSDAVVRYQAHAMGGQLFFEDAAVVLSLPATWQWAASCAPDL